MRTERDYLTSGRRMADNQAVTPVGIRPSKSLRQFQMPSEPATELRRFLLAGRNPDGGWGYYPGKRSRVEPTCWAALALGTAHGDGEAVDRACAVLGAWQRADGLVAEPGLAPDVAFNGLTLLVLDWRQRGRPGRADAAAARLCQALRAVKVLQLRDDPDERQNNQLRGWPWTEGAFSWVEPTAWCVLALKKWRLSATSEGPALDARIAEGDAMLLDRICRGGGWNYGNSNVLGQHLHPYVPTTAEALLALQDRRPEVPVGSGLEFLANDALRERSGTALSLALLALGVYNSRVPGIVEALTAAWKHTRFLNNFAVTAMAAYAIAADEHGADALTL